MPGSASCLMDDAPCAMDRRGHVPAVDEACAMQRPHPWGGRDVVDAPRAHGHRPRNGQKEGAPQSGPELRPSANAVSQADGTGHQVFSSERALMSDPFTTSAFRLRLRRGAASSPRSRRDGRLVADRPPGPRRVAAVRGFAAVARAGRGGNAQGPAPPGRRRQCAVRGARLAGMADIRARLRDPGRHDGPASLWIAGNR